jgi:hypothetical protein
MRWTLPVAALLVTSLAQAGDTPPPGPGRYPMDANRDGFVTREEANDYPMLSAQFDVADANEDGKVERAEMHQFRMRQKDRKGSSEQL